MAANSVQISSMKINILLVEDNEHKRDRVLAYLSETLPSATVSEARSYASGCQEIESDKFDLIIMDISLPTYDRAGQEGGGRFRSNGGREIARKIMRRKISTPIVFLTQYEAFSDRGNSLSLIELGELLAQECLENFRGLIYFDSSKSAWKSELDKIIKLLK